MDWSDLPSQKNPSKQKVRNNNLVHNDRRRRLIIESALVAKYRGVGICCEKKLDVRMIIHLQLLLLRVKYVQPLLLSSVPSEILFCEVRE